jgi:hypothetical protein
LFIAAMSKFIDRCRTNVTSEEKRIGTTPNGDPTAAAGPLEVERAIGRNRDWRPSEDEGRTMTLISSFCVELMGSLFTPFMQPHRSRKCDLC